MFNEGFLSLIIRPIKSGDDEDEEDETDFRPELYAYNPPQQKVRIKDSDIKREAVSTSYTEQKAQSAFKMILRKGAHIDDSMMKDENTKAIIAEMAAIESQLEDFLWDVFFVFDREKNADVDRETLRDRALTVLEIEIPEDIKSALE